MRTLLVVLFLLVIGIAVLGFYRGWFVISSSSTDQQPSATIRVDTDKINANEAKAKANWAPKMAEWETKRDAARVKLTEVGHAGAEAWKDAQQGAQAAWNELDKAFRDASREF